MERYSKQYNWPHRAEEYEIYQNKKEAKKQENQWKRFMGGTFKSTTKEEGALNQSFR